MPFLPPNQQRQSTEGTIFFVLLILLSICYPIAFSALTLLVWAAGRASGL